MTSFGEIIKKKKIKKILPLDSSLVQSVDWLQLASQMKVQFVGKKKGVSCLKVMSAAKQPLLKALRLRRGDLIRSINGEALRTPLSVPAIIARGIQRNFIYLTVVRKDKKASTWAARVVSKPQDSSAQALSAEAPALKAAAAHNWTYAQQAYLLERIARQLPDHTRRSSQDAIDTVLEAPADFPPQLVALAALVGEALI